MSTLGLIKDLLQKFEEDLENHEEAFAKGHFSLALHYLELCKSYMEQVREIAFQTGTEELVIKANDDLKEVTFTFDILKAAVAFEKSRQDRLAAQRVVH